MELRCKQCGQIIPGENVSIQGNIAKCDNCSNVFALDELSLEAQYKKAVVPMPPKMSAGLDYNGLRITRKWFGAKAVFFIIFCAFWNGFMAFWFYIAVTERLYPMAAFGSLHALVGLGLLYYTIASLINTTTIRVNHNELNIRHAPVPWPAPKPIGANTLSQLYSKHRITRSSKGGVTHHYELRAQTTDNRDIKILAGLDNGDQVRYLEQEIEKYLGIRDKPVEGEMR